MARAKPAQPSLFGDAVEGSAVVAVAIKRPSAELGKEQKRFNRLTGQIRRQRKLLAEWQTCSQRIADRWQTELDPLVDGIHETQRQLARRMDVLLSKHAVERLSRRHRKGLVSALLELLDDLLAAAGPDAELEALYDRHADVSRAEQRQQQLAMTEAMLSDVLGADLVAGHAADDVESLLRHVHEQTAAREKSEHERQQKRKQEASERASKRPRSKAQEAAARKAEAAAERLAQAAQDASQSVRDIYRKLVSALHPDRETDPAQRARKTLLMQRTNQAYERDDLLELLSLQIEIEQIDAGHLADVPEHRLRHYNKVLHEQLKAIEIQVLHAAAPILGELGLPRYTMPTSRAEMAFSQRVAEARRVQRQLKAELKACDNPAQRRGWLDVVCRQVETVALDGFDFDFMDALLGTGGAPHDLTSGRRRR